MILLDFYGGTHGHFLEYIINTYIFPGNRVDNLLTELGTSHNAVKNVDYGATRIVRCGHYSQLNLSVPDPECVITISVDSEFENICYQINVECRSGDIPQEIKQNNIPESIRNSKHQLRNAYYSKFSESSLSYQLPTNLTEHWQSRCVPAFNVPMSSLYDFRSFYVVLKNLSNFLNHTFNPDPGLAILWQKFIDLNHGVNAWTKTTDVVKQSLLNLDQTFESTVIEQALINYHLTKIIGIQDGPLFEHDQYPTHTKQIGDIIQDYINNFDSRF